MIYFLTLLAIIGICMFVGGLSIVSLATDPPTANVGFMALLVSVVVLVSTFVAHLMWMFIG